MGDRDHYLHGADDVRSAAGTMARAAETMSSAASTMSHAADRLIGAQQEQQIFLTDWLQRFEAVLYQDREARRAVRDGR